MKIANFQAQAMKRFFYNDTATVRRSVADCEHFRLETDKYEAMTAKLRVLRG